MWVMRRFAGSDPDIRARKRYVDRHFTKYQPYENMIYTFLGPAAFEYYSMGSREGKAKVQPHEVSTS
jgi:hypothetical protein